jgi:excinuclease ABC subunit B
VDIDINETIKELEEEMLGAANNLEFEKAALLRDQIRELKRAMDGGESSKSPKADRSKAVTYGKGKRRSGSKNRQTNVPF